MAQSEYAVLRYRKAQPAGWHLNRSLLAETHGCNALDCIKHLNRDGWELMLSSQSAFYLTRAQSPTSLAPDES